jgi:hypothetical protein
LKQNEAKQLLSVLQGPGFSHWVRDARVVEATTGAVHVICYVEWLSSLLVTELERIGQQFNVTWQAEPSRKTNFILVRFLTD